MHMRNGGKLSVGDWVEVKSKEEILRTLDRNAQLDGLPFMPEMFAFCGRRFRVEKRAHKTCDTVFPIRGRRMANAVHLAARCDGQAHGGCQAGCLIFWKEAWLRKVGDSSQPDPLHRQGPDLESPLKEQANCTERGVFEAVRAPNEPGSGDPIFVCQATR